jgi:muramoyltetrapeptide carboxypeptidase LdcA involved in peptidoglycan recycling
MMRLKDQVEVKRMALLALQKSNAMKQDAINALFSVPGGFPSSQALPIIFNSIEELLR